MIKTKNTEIETYEARLKSKDQELAELTAKCTKLEAKAPDSKESKKNPSVKKASEKSEDMLPLQFGLPQ